MQDLLRCIDGLGSRIPKSRIPLLQKFEDGLGIMDAHVNQV
jgi:hypothetical protein